MTAEHHIDVGAARIDAETLLPRVGDHRLDQLGCHSAPTDFRRHKRVRRHANVVAARDPVEVAGVLATRNRGRITPTSTAIIVRNGHVQHFGHRNFLLLAK